MTNKPLLPADFCPYVGLNPYTESDREFFFGRERDLKLIISNLYAMPLTVLYGASGVGKTSVLLAGVVPELKKASEVDLVVFRKWQGADFSNALKEEVLSSVVRGLDADQSSVLLKIDELTVEEQSRLDNFEREAHVGDQKAANEKAIQETKARLNALSLIRTFLKGNLRIEGITFDELLLKCTLVSTRTIFLILDQFEEYFLYHPASQSSESFDAEFARAVNRKDIPVKFLLSMREEELGKLGRFRGRIPNMLSNPIFLKHLNEEAAELAIREPLEEYNRRVTASQKMGIHDELVAAVIKKSRQVSRERGEGIIAAATGVQLPIETPILQMLLTKIWEEERQAGSSMMRLSTLEALGGAENIVHTYLDGVMSTMREPQLAIAAEMFRFLVTPSGSKIAHTLPDLAGYTKKATDQIELTLEPLLNSPTMRVMRKITVSGHEDRYEIFHDVLGKSIEDWRRRYEIRLDEQAEAERRQQLRRANRRRVGVMALVAALIGMSGLTVYAFKQRSSARSAVARAEAAQAETEKSAKQLIQKTIDATNAEKAAEDERAIAAQQKRDFEFKEKLASAQLQGKIALAKSEEAQKQRANAEKLRSEADAALAEKIEEEERADENAELFIQSVTEVLRLKDLAEDERQLNKELTAQIERGAAISTPGAKGTLKLRLLNVYGEPLEEKISIRLQNRAISDEGRLLKDVQASAAIDITGLPTFPSGVYRLEISSPSYRPVSQFVNLKPSGVTELSLTVPVDPARIRKVEFPAFQKLPDDVQTLLMSSNRTVSFEGKHGQDLYNALDDIRRASLLNIIAKSRATQLIDGTNVFSHVQSMNEVRGDRLFAVVSKDLMEKVRNSTKNGLFREVDVSLYVPRPGFKNGGGFKTPDRYGNLQITFFVQGETCLAEIDIDESSGLEHELQVNLNRLTGRPTHPYDIHEILVQYQQLDPGYRLIP